MNEELKACPIPLCFGKGVLALEDNGIIVFVAIDAACPVLATKRNHWQSNLGIGEISYEVLTLATLQIPQTQERL